MSNINYTPSQKKAIFGKGSLVVSASAGSGKTTVMIERVMEKIRNGASLNNMMIVTFTNASSADMKEKLYKKLLNEGFDNEIKLLPTADISTLSSWCQRLIRKYFYILGIDPSFEIIDESTEKALFSRACDNVINRMYNSLDPTFLELSSLLNTRRNDKHLKDIIKTIHLFAQSQPSAIDWLNQSLENAFNKDMFSAYRDEIFTLEAEYYLEINQKLVLEVEMLIKQNKNEGKDTKELEKLLDILMLIDSGLKDSSVSDIGGRLSKVSENLDLYERVKSHKEKCVKFKKRMNEIAQASFNNSDTFSCCMKQLAIDVEKEYATLKQRRSQLDFSDLECKAYEILSNLGVNQEICTKYKYIFVDEYQDINRRQDEIVKALHKDNELFLVGDVKQSIYAFRMCDPTIFAYKIEHYKEEGFDDALPLNENFRSSSQIVNFTNDIFAPIMTKNFGDVDYSNEQLVCGTHDNSGSIITTCIIKDKKDTQVDSVYDIMQDYQNNEKSGEEEFCYIVEKINSLIEQGTELKEIAILARSIKNVSNLYTRLTSVGIPVSMEQNIEYKITEPTKLLINFCYCLDDFTDDIPLIAMLQSPLYKLTQAQLMTISRAYLKYNQINKNERYFYKAVDYYIANFTDEIQQKLSDFIDLRNRYYQRSLVDNVSEILGDFVAEVKLFNYIYAMEDGKVNAQITGEFLDFVSNSPYNDNIYDFVDYFSSDSPCFEGNAKPDSVKIMTIHGSKGLEFKYVFLINTNSNLVKNDEQGDIFLDKNYGLVLKNFESSIDDETAQDCKSFQYMVMKEHKHLNRLSEEMRLLYVAVTRAKSTLDIVVTLTSDEKQKLFSGDYKCDKMNVQKYIEWLAPALVTSKIQCFSYEDFAYTRENIKKQVVFTHKDSKLTDLLKKRFEFSYPYTQTKIKSTVTKIASEEDMSLSNIVVYKEKDGDNANALLRGTAYHKFMELVDFDADFSSEWTRISQLYEDIKLYVDKQKVCNACKIISALIFAKKTYREQSFVYNHNGTLVQGTIDLLVVDGSSAFIVDYKTTKHNLLNNNYKKQMQLYSDAVSKILGLKVDYVALYSFERQKLIKISY